jgi:hypothetical protein
VIEEFDTEESGFQDIQDKLERDLRKIRGARLEWQTETDEPVYSHDEFEEDFDDEPPMDQEFQSYHVFFLVPDGDEFRFETETETEGFEPPDPLDEGDVENEEDGGETTVPGKGLIGCAAAVCLTVPVAIVEYSSRSEYADGTASGGDVDRSIYSDDPKRIVTPEAYYRSQVSAQAFQKLEGLRAKIVAVLQKHRLEVLDDSVLDLPVAGLKASKEVFMMDPIRVRDAFFFHGA